MDIFWIYQKKLNLKNLDEIYLHPESIPVYKKI